MLLNRDTGRKRCSLLGVTVCMAILACDSSTAPKIEAGALTFQKLALGMQHTCGLTTEGDAYCWGEDGMLGSTALSQANRPRRVAGDRRYFDISIGSHTMCALETVDSTAYCWGRSADDSWSSLTPSQISNMRFKVLSLGINDGNHCGLTGDGEVFCWSSNVYGQAGTGTRDAVPNPTAIASPLRATAIGASFHACLLTASGAAHCWGSDISGQVGRSDTPPSCEPLEDCMITAPTAVIGGHTFASITVGGGHTCALTADGSAYCWGNNLKGEVGATAHPTRCKPIIPCNPAPALVEGPSFASITAGSQTTCGVTVDGKGYCWGYNEEGQLGNGNRTNQPQPTAVSGSIQFRVIYPGIRHTCGIAVSGHAYCWGNNIIGGLGIGRFGEIFMTPVPVGAPEGG